MDDQPPVKLDVPYFLHDPVEHMRAIKWCEGHWTELITALRSRGLESQIAESAEALNQKFLNRPGPTNVIAFPMREGEFAGISPQLLGDVLISIDTAQREGERLAYHPRPHIRTGGAHQKSSQTV